MMTRSVYAPPTRSLARRDCDSTSASIKNPKTLVASRRGLCQLETLNPWRAKEAVKCPYKVEEQGRCTLCRHFLARVHAAPQPPAGSALPPPGSPAMSYNGIGLQTTRGSGTNGYVQSNKFFRVQSRLERTEWRDIKAIHGKAP